MKCNHFLLIFLLVFPCFSEAEEQKQFILAKDLQRGDYVRLPAESAHVLKRICVVRCTNRDGATAKNADGITMSGFVFVRYFKDYTDLSPSEETELKKLAERSGLTFDQVQSRTMGYSSLKPEEQLQTYIPSDKFKKESTDDLNAKNGISY